MNHGSPQMTQIKEESITTGGTGDTGKEKRGQTRAFSVASPTERIKWPGNRPIVL